MTYFYIKIISLLKLFKKKLLPTNPNISEKLLFSSWERLVNTKIVHMCNYVIILNV